MSLCQCGCEQETENKFIHGHNPPWNKGLKDGFKDLLEIKPKWKLKDKETLVKLKAMKEYSSQQGWGFKVWTEDQLDFQKGGKNEWLLPWMKPLIAENADC